MKNKLILAIFCALSFITGQAQTFNSKPIPINAANPTRGNYGTIQAFTYMPGQICTIVTGTVTPMPSTRAADTLQIPTVNITGYGTDSGYAQFYFPNNLDKILHLGVTKISGTLAGTVVFQGSLDNATWHTLTGNTTYCTDCIGASATITNTAGTKYYDLYLPHSAINYPFLQAFVLLSGTCTATFTCIGGYQY